MRFTRETDGAVIDIPDEEWLVYVKMRDAASWLIIEAYDKGYREGMADARSNDLRMNRLYGREV